MLFVRIGKAIVCRKSRLLLEMMANQKKRYIQSFDWHIQAIFYAEGKSHTSDAQHSREVSRQMAHTELSYGYKALSNAIVYRYKLSSLVRKNIGDSEMELIHTMKVRRGVQVSDVDGVRCRLADDTRVMSEASYTSISNCNDISLINAYN